MSFFILASPSVHGDLVVDDFTASGSLNRYLSIHAFGSVIYDDIPFQDVIVDSLAPGSPAYTVTSPSPNTLFFEAVPAFIGGYVDLGAGDSVLTFTGLNSQNDDWASAAGLGVTYVNSDSVLVDVASFWGANSTGTFSSIPEPFECSTLPFPSLLGLRFEAPLK